MPKSRQPSRKPGPAPAPHTEAGDEILADVGGASVLLSLHEQIYSLSILHQTAYQFLARAWVRLDRTRDGRLSVRLQPKPGQAADRAALAALAGEFANELTQQYVREEIAARTTRLREAVVGRALLGALGTADELAGLGDPGEDPFGADPAADPLGIAVDWEVRFGKPADKARAQPERLHASDPNVAAGAAELAARADKDTLE